MDETEIDTDTIIAAPLPAPGFAISSTLLRRLGARMQPHGEDWFMTVEIARVGNDEGLRVPAYYLHFKRKVAMRKRIERLRELAVKIGKTLVEMSCTIDGRPSTLLACNEADIGIVHLDKKEDARGTPEQKAMVEGDALMLAIMSQATGIRVVYCFGGGVIHPPQPEKEHQITFFAHARPPGFVERELSLTELFGMPLWKDGATYFVASPTRGRGRIIEAGGKPVFQVLGSNYYQLCLTHDGVHDPLNRAKLFLRMVSEVMKDLDHQAVGMNDGVDERDPEERIATFVSDLTTKDLKALRSKLEDADAAIERLQTELAGQFKKKQELTVSISARKDAALPRLLAERMPDDIAGMEDIPGVASVDIVDGGIHLTTDPVTLEDEGVRHPLGPFTIRLDPLVGKVVAWSDAPRHPDGHHHPHIARDALSCFGSISIALLKCMAVFDYRSAAELAVQWLHSYNKANTLYPLSEFPAEPAAGPAKEETHVDATAG